MSETTYTTEELTKMWEALEPTLKDAINAVNTQVDEHNANVAIIRASKEGESPKLLQEIREQNPQGDAALKTLNKRITELNKQIEELVSQANDIAKKYLPKKLTDEEIAKAQEALKTSGSAIKQAVTSLETFEGLVGKPLSVHVKQANSARGLALIGRAGSSDGETWRPRLSKVFINDEACEREVKNTKGEKVVKSNFTILTAELNKRTKSDSFSTAEIQKIYLEAAGGDKDNIPEEVKFTLPYTYSTENGEQTLEFEIKVVK